LRTTLENGLKVVLVEDHSAPVVALYAWVRAGSADERPHEAGMAHLFEHMLFKGTARRGVGEIAATVEGAGGDINAFTSLDMTVYHITMASRDAATGVDVLADALCHSSFDPEELAKESEVVVEEIRRSMDSPDHVLSEALFATAYVRHPYRLPVIGSEASVRSFTRAQLLEFYARWYAPNNITFVAVGDFAPEPLLAQIRTAFAGAAPRAELVHPREAEPVQAQPRAALLRQNFEQTRFGLAFPITAFEHADTAYLDLLGMIIGEGDSSRLYQRVKERQQLVYEISASSYTPLDAGLLLVEAVLEPEELEPALRSVAAELARLCSAGPSAAELERARINLLASSAREKETLQGQASKYGYYESLGGGIEQEAAYLARARAAQPSDLRRVAREYLRPQRASLVVLLPKEERPELAGAALLAEIERGFRAQAAPAGRELAPGIRRYELPNGLRLIVKPSPRVPVVSLRLAFHGGTLAESEDTQGLGSFFAELIDRGTEQRSAAQLAAEIEGIAGSLEGFSGRNSFGLQGDFMTDSLETGLELFADVLLHPRFAPEEIEKARTDTLAALERLEDNPQGKAFELFAQGLYPQHPYRFRALGTPQSVARFDQAALRRHYESYAHPRAGVLSVVGDVEPDAIAAALAGYLADWEDKPARSLPPRRAPEARSAPTELSATKDKNQVHIAIGFPGVRVGDPDLPALEVLTQLLGSQSGRLFLELRDRQSLAYSTTAFATPGVDAGSFGVYIASAPDKLEEAREGLLRELRRVLDEPVGEPELDKARRYLIGSQAVSLQSYATQASLLALDELYGLGATYYLGYEQRIAAVSAQDIQRVAQRLIDLRAPVIAVVR
jgi:zinc protease